MFDSNNPSTRVPKGKIDSASTARAGTPMVFLARKMKGAFGGSTCIDHGAFQDRNESKALWGVILSKEVIHQRLEKVKHNFSKNKYSKKSLAVQVMVIMPKK